MSKVYEALQRAEQERTAEEQQAQNAVHAPTQNSAPRTSSQLATVPLTPQESIEQTQPALSETLRRDLQYTSNGSGALSYTKNVQVWHPLKQNLPALEFRGSKIEQFRSLRSKLFGLRHVQQFRSIFIGSGRPTEGKSYIAANLAIALARHKSTEVLLIDGDMRQGTLHKTLGSPNRVGLAEFLGGKATLDEVLQRGKSADGIEALPQGLTSLTFCPSGHAGDRAAELSGSPKFPEMIRMLESKFDWIIVDSSPVNLVADGVNLARACDSALLVARGGVTKFETAQRALQELKSVKVLGVVLNAVEDPVSSDGHYGYHGYNSEEE